MKTATLDKTAVGGKPTHPTELIQKIQKGLRFSELKTLQDTLDLPFEKLAAKLCISRSTLQRRKAAGRLSPDESTKWSVFHDCSDTRQQFSAMPEKARAWLKHPQVGLGGAVPLDYASTETGAREVENLLGRIEYSVYT
jgi:putative toxin-antitoxin system antitoxin component (TIGR02293 family)